MTEADRTDTATVLGQRTELSGEEMARRVDRAARYLPQVMFVLVPHAHC